LRAEAVQLARDHVLGSESISHLGQAGRSLFTANKRLITGSLEQLADVFARKNGAALAEFGDNNGGDRACGLFHVGL
jgi:hypothetical protein